MSPSTDFSGLWIPLITPFRDGSLDRPALAALTRRMRADGVAGFVACGSTGEAAALTADEQLEVLQTVLDAAAGLPVVCGVGGSSLRETLEWVARLGEWPLAGLLVSAPQYVRPGQAGVRQWFEAIADAAGQPVMVYDIPYRTGTAINRETLLQLGRHPNIQALKDCGGDMAKTLAVLNDGGLQVLAGEDLQIFATLAQGGSGAVAASAHVATRHFVRLLDHLRAGALPEAQALWRTLVPWIEAAFSEPNPGPVKAVLAALGESRGELRPPMQAATTFRPDAVLPLLQALQRATGSAARDRREERDLARTGQ
jgi:4-hydroxy-tetrahydrodipicolinate synthase